jgi:hypothetical protein
MLSKHCVGFVCAMLLVLGTSVTAYVDDQENNDVDSKIYVVRAPKLAKPKTTTPVDPP